MHGYGLFTNSYLIKEDMVVRFLLNCVLGLVAWDDYKLGKSLKPHLMCAL